MVDPTRRVLVVCTANVSRSPMGEALLRARVASAGLPVEVHSAGVEADRHRLPVDPLAVQAISSYGLDITGHSPRGVTRSLVDDADLVLTMTRDDLRRVVVVVPRAFWYTFTWKELLRRSSGVTSGASWSEWLATAGHQRSARDLMGSEPNDDVVDPYSGTAEDRVRCAAELAQLADALVGVWRRLAW